MSRFPAAVLGIAIFLALLSAACGGGEEAGATPTEPQPAAERSPEATPTPENTPEPAVIEEYGYRADALLPHVEFALMVGMEAIPDDDDHALLLTKDGLVRRFSLVDPGEEITTYLDVRDRLIADPRLEEGLLGLAFAPDFEESRHLYINYTAGTPTRNVISRFVANETAADPESETVIIEVEQPRRNHNGGALKFGPDGYLYISLGDGGGGGDPDGHGQNTNTLLGTIVRIAPSADGGYTVPDDNPFVDGGGLPEIWAYGLRNPWRISFDTETGELWAADVGQYRVEEVNRIERGGNYGWAIMEGPDCFEAQTCNTEGLILPRAWYYQPTGCAVTGGYVYQGTSLPELDGWYVYGDYCTGIVWALNTRDDEAEPLVLMESGFTITSFGQDNDGELYLVTFENQVLRLARGE